MVKTAFCTTIALAVVGLTTGCGTTAPEIAQSYGVLNQHGWQQAAADKIASGEADEMIAKGLAPTRHHVCGSGEDRVLVVEHLIEGEVYRVDTHLAIDPTINLSWSRLYYALAQQGPKERKIQWGALMTVWSALKNNSFAAQPTIAYRAWRDNDGEVHDVRIVPSIEPQWMPTDMATNLVIRTFEWPIASMWLTGLTQAATEPNVTPPDDLDYYDRFTPSGKWIVQSAGPGEQGLPTSVQGQTHIINYELYDAVWGPNW